MEVIQVIRIIFLSYIASVIYTFFCSKILGKKFKFNKKNIICFIIYATFIIVNQFNSINFYQLMVLIIMETYYVKFIFKTNYIKSAIIAISYFFISIISKLVFMTFIDLFFKEKVLQIIGSVQYQYSIIIFIINIVLIMLTTKHLKKIFVYIGKDGNNSIIVPYLSLFFVLSFLTKKHYINGWNNIASPILSLVFTIAMILFFSYSVKNSLNTYFLKRKYTYLTNYSEIYDEIMEEYYLKNHEYKNQLAIIKTLNKSKEIDDYINTLIEKDVDIKHKWIRELKVIKVPGICALLNYKLSEMNKEGINVCFVVSKSMKNYRSNIFTDKQFNDIYTILGVLIDNAKDAALESKDKKVFIDIGEDEDKIVIEISNSYNPSKVVVKKIGEKNYTSKGKGHGMGLYLIKKMITKSKIMKIDTNISKKLFKQILTIEVDKGQMVKN